MKTLIETERLLLREITLDDTLAMFELYTNADVLKYTGEPMVTSMAEMQEAIKVRTSEHEQYGYGRWATILKDSNAFIGWAGLAYLPEFDEIDIGYRFLPNYWSKGYATEASRAILAHGFKELNLKRIIAIAMKGNEASIRIMKKIGMKFEKFAPYEEGSEDAVWYVIEKSAYNKSI